MRDSSAVNTMSSSLEVGGQHHPLDCAETHIISLTPTHSSHDHVVSVLTIKTFNTCVRIVALLQKLYLQELPFTSSVHLYRLGASP